MENKDLNSIKIEVDVNVYPLEAIYGTSYVFLDRAYIFIDQVKANKIIVYLKGKNKLSVKDKDDLQGEFLNELLNYSFRSRLAKENKKTREYMIEQALFGAINQSSGLSDQPGYNDDPLGIAVSWEKKYGRKK